jgi:hypothetical protein
MNLQTFLARSDKYACISSCNLKVNFLQHQVVVRAVIALKYYMCGRYLPSLLRKDGVQSLNMFWFEIRKEHNPMGRPLFWRKR